MKTVNPVEIRSAAAWQLVQSGDAASQGALANAVRGLTDESLSGLEEELQFFSETGFVGVLMSRVLSGLFDNSARLAA